MPNHVTNIITINAEPERVKEILYAIQEDEAGVGSIDFNKLHPMPESLNIESGSTTDDCIRLYLTSINPLIGHFGENKKNGNEYARIVNLFNQDKQRFVSYQGELSPDDVKKKMESMIKYAEGINSVEDIFTRAKTALNNIMQYGHQDWYGWSAHNWGTKWNAYTFGGYADGNDTITFETAWAAPHPILELLSEKFPDAEFCHSWADEDIGCNVGKAVYRDGEATYESIPRNQSAEAYEMAAEIHGESLESRGLFKTADGQGYEYREEEEYEEMEV